MILFKTVVSRPLVVLYMMERDTLAVYSLNLCTLAQFFYLSLQTIANWLFFQDNLKVAISRPRLHCQLFPPTIVYEPTFPEALVPKLKSFHHVSVTNSTYDVSG